MALDKATLTALRADINAALLAVGTKHGMTISTGRCSYDTATATFQLLVAQKGEGHEEGASAVDIKAAEDWKRYARLEGLGVDWLGKEITRRGHPGLRWKILGYMPRRRSYPVLVQRMDNGKRVLITIDEVVGICGAPVKA